MARKFKTMKLFIPIYLSLQLKLRILNVFVTTQWLLWRFNLPFLWFEWHGGCLWKWTGVHLTYLILHNLISVVVQSSLQTFQNWQPLRWNPIEKNNLIHIVGMLVIQIHVSWFGIVLPDLFHELLLNIT